MSCCGEARGGGEAPPCLARRFISLLAILLVDLNLFVLCTVFVVGVKVHSSMSLSAAAEKGELTKRKWGDGCWIQKKLEALDLFTCSVAPPASFPRA